MNLTSRTATLLTIVLISVGRCRAAAVNLVANSSFEEATCGSPTTHNPWQPTGWTLGVEGSTAGILRRASDGFHGSSAARITNQSQRKPGLSVYMFQDVAVKRNKGKEAAEFRGEPVTVTVENGAYAGIYESSKEVAVSLKVNNHRSRALSVTADWKLSRLPDGKRISRGKVSLEVKPKGSIHAVLPFPKEAAYGLYEYSVGTSTERYKIESEARVAIMRAPPRGREMDNLGFNVHGAVALSPLAEEDYARLLRRMGVRWARVDWCWELYEPHRRGEVAWDTLGGLDQQVRVAAKHGLRLFPCFGHGQVLLPEWARLQDGTFDPQAHADFIRQVLQRYRGKISAINVWNEPGDPHVTQNRKLWELELKAVREAVRSVDPSCKIVGFTMGGRLASLGGGIGYLKPPLAWGRFLDAVDWHNYACPRNLRPENTEADGSPGIDGLRESMPELRSLVAGKEVWITEHGFSTCNPLEPSVARMIKDMPGLAPFDVTEKQQGDYLVRQVILELAYGIDRVFLYQLGPDGPGGGFEEQFGITRVRPNGLSAKVAYVQVANMIQELAGADPVGVEMPSPSMRVVRFRRGSTDVVAAWTVRNTATLSFRVHDGYQSDPFGNRNPKQGATTVELAESPIFLVGKRIKNMAPGGSM